MSFGRLINKSKRMFQKQPFVMNVTAYGTVCVSAEIAQQTVRIINSKQDSINWSSVGRFAIVGTAGMAPFLFNFYKCLDYALPAATGGMVVAKVASVLLMCSPTSIAIFFTGMGALEGKEDIFAELKAKFWSTYKLSCCFWLPAQAINFALLPPYTRVAFVGVASFIWVNVLCLVKRQEISEPKTEIPEVSEKAAKE